MKFEFDKLINRYNIGNLKDITLLDNIRKAGMISFASAEMDFKTAPCVIEAVVRRAKNGLFGYTLQDKQYNDAIVWWFKTVRGWDIDSSWIVPTLGTIKSVATAIRLTTKEGEGIIVQPPVYYRYEQAATRNNRKMVYNPLIYDNGKYRIDFDNLEKCMADPNNKLLVICNPHNPISKVWPKEDLERIAYLSKKYEVVVFSDEIFAEIVFDNNKVVPYASIEEGQEFAITSTSLGKSFNFTGVNNANLIIPNKKLREAFVKQRDADHYGSIDPLVHAATLAAYTEDGLEWLSSMVSYVHDNIKYINKFFSENIKKAKIVPTEGTFVIWIDWRGLNIPDERLYEVLEQKALLQLEHGDEYGKEGAGFSRMSIATPRSYIVKALENLKAALEEEKLI